MKRYAGEQADYIPPGFISHMVQMKLALYLKAFLLQAHFISHMVQMKLIYFVALRPAQCCFISHMVQMKLIYFVALRPAQCCFISHMVQMKHCPLMQPSAAPAVVTLYPTWFRWNMELLWCDEWSKRLYIPHGSDETHTRELWRACMRTLYPTWFRWNHIVTQMRLLLLMTLYPTWFRWN